MSIYQIVNLNDDSYECEDYRPIVERFVPELSALIKTDSRKTKLIQERFLSRLIAVGQAIDEDGEFSTTSKTITFFDVLFDAIENNASAEALLVFINTCIKDILPVIPKSFRIKIKDIAYDMVVNFNEKESCFYSRVAELACLKEVLKNGILKIKDIEKTLSNGKSVDMVIQHNGSDSFIDVLSIHVTEDKISSNDKMYKFLYKRMADKYEKKFHDLADLSQCAIMPVLWGNLIEFKQYQSALDKFFTDYKNQVIHPHGLVYIPQRGYIFTSIKNITEKIG